MSRADAPGPTADGPRPADGPGVPDTAAAPAPAAVGPAAVLAAVVPAARVGGSRVLSPFDPRVADWARAVSVPAPRPGGRGS